METEDFSDDDGYFDKLQEQADNDPDVIDVKYLSDCYGEVETSEEEYYDKIQHENTQFSAVLDETSKVWKHVLQENTSSLGSDDSKSVLLKLSAENSDVLEEMRQSLFATLPSSCSLYCLLHTKVARQHVDLWVDRVLNPQFVLVLKRNSSLTLVKDVFIYSAFPSSTLEYLHCACKILCDCIKERSKTGATSEIVFEAIDSFTHFAVTDYLANHFKVAVKWANLCSLQALSASSSYLLSNKLPELSAQLPPGYRYCRLRQSDASVINDTWPYKDAESYEMIRGMMVLYPCIGIAVCPQCFNDASQGTKIRSTNSSSGKIGVSSSSRNSFCGTDCHSNNTNEYNHNNDDAGCECNHSDLSSFRSSGNATNDDLVSWCLTYEYGALGILYTKPEHRNRGIGKLALLGGIATWASFGFGCAPFSFVTDENDVSKKLLSSMGFEKINDVYWSGY